MLQRVPFTPTRPPRVVSVPQVGTAGNSLVIMNTNAAMHASSPSSGGGAAAHLVPSSTTTTPPSHNNTSNNNNPNNSHPNMQSVTPTKPARNPNSGSAARRTRRRVAFVAALVGALVVTAVAAFLASFFPLLFQSIDASISTANDFAQSILANVENHVATSCSLALKGFDALDSAGIQNLFQQNATDRNVYWLLRAKLIGPVDVSLVFNSGDAIFVSEFVPCNSSVPSVAQHTHLIAHSSSSDHDERVWVTQLHAANLSYEATQWRLAGIDTAPIAGTTVVGTVSNSSDEDTTRNNEGDGNVCRNVTQTAWYQYMLKSIYPQWHGPETDIAQKDTVLFIGAQGGTDVTARENVYTAAISRRTLSALLSSLQSMAFIVLYHVETGAVVGTNFDMNPVVTVSTSANSSSSSFPQQTVLRPRTIAELDHASPFLASVLRTYNGAITACQDACVLDTGEGFDRLFLRVQRVRGLSYGLNLTMVIAMPVTSFVEKIKEARDNSLIITLPVVAVATLMLAAIMYATVQKANTFLRERRRTTRR